MVATMAGLQLAREKVADNPAPLLARMTVALRHRTGRRAAAGPVLAPDGWAGWGAFTCANAAANVLLVLTAAWL
jgi:hypothetical protein